MAVERLTEDSKFEQFRRAVISPLGWVLILLGYVAIAYLTHLWGDTQGIDGWHAPGSLILGSISLLVTALWAVIVSVLPFVRALANKR